MPSVDPPSTVLGGTRDAANLAILNGITRQRQISNYFFIAINILMVSVDFALSVYCVSYPFGSSARYFGLLISASFGVVVLPLAIYWIRELQEFQQLQETMFQALMDEERIYSDRGTLSRFWDRIGDLPGRRTAVFSVRLTRMLPLLFACLQIIPLYGNVFLWGAHERLDQMLPISAPARPH